MQLDHVFVFVEDGAAAVAAVEAAGLRVTHRRRHHRQGTENACFGFGAVFVELLWVVDPAEVQSPAVERTGLWGRSQWVRTGACPFGVCVRGTLPGPTWTYAVPFPPGMSVEMAADSARAGHPLRFAFGAPGARSGVHQPDQASITGLELAYPAAGTGPTAVLEKVGVTQRVSNEPWLTLELDGGLRGTTTRVPAARLCVRR